MEYKSFLDAREIEPETKLDFDICVVGGGAAGITIARGRASIWSNGPTVKER